MKTISVLIAVLFLSPCISYGKDEKIVEFEIIGAGYACIRKHDKENGPLFDGSLANEMADNAKLNRSDAYDAINKGMSEVRKINYEMCDTFVLGSAMMLKKYSKNKDAIAAMQMLANRINGKNFFNVAQKSSNSKCEEKDLGAKRFVVEYIARTSDDDGNVKMIVKRISDGANLQIDISQEEFDNNFANINKSDFLDLNIGHMQSGEFDPYTKQCVIRYYFKSGYNRDDSSAMMKKFGLSFGDLIAQLETVKFLSCAEFVSDDADDADIPAACAKYKPNEYILFRNGGKGHASGDGGKTKTPITWRQNSDDQTCVDVALKDKVGAFCLHKNPQYLDGRGNPMWGLSTAYIADPSWLDQ